MDNDKKQTYNVNIDLLRILAILAVVFIHTTTRTLAISNADLNHLPFTFLINQGARFAVPLFFLISGFVLELNYDSNKSYIYYLKKRVNRIFIPYIFWSAVYYLIIYNHHDIYFFNALLNGDASYQLYFIPALLIFYIIFPVLHRIYRIIASPLVLIVLTFLQLSILYSQYYLQPLKFYHPAAVAILNYDVFLIGIVCSRHIDGIKYFLNKWKLEILLGTLILLFYVYFEGKTLYFKTHNYFYYYSQWRPSIFVYSIFLTGSLYTLLSNIKFSSEYVKLFSKLSFFIFFIHIFILEQAWNIIFYPIYLSTHGTAAIHLWFDIAYFIFVTTVSFIIAYIIHKLPFISKVTG